MRAMLIRIPPLQAIFMAFTLSLIVLISGPIILSSAPKIGVQFQSISGSSISVAKVYKDSPAEKAGLKEGDVITGLSADKNNSVLLNRDTLVSDPDIFPTYQQFNAFIEKQKQISDIVSQTTFYLVKSNNTYIEVQALNELKVTWLPMWYWLMILLASCIFVIGTSIFAHNPLSKATSFLFLMGLSLYSASICYTLYGAREFATPLIDFIKLFIAIKHISLIIFALVFFSLIWSYPKELKFGVIYWLGVFTSIICMIISTFQIIDLPVHSYYISYLLPTLLGIYATILQYLKSKDSLIDKAILLWTASASFVTILVIYVLHILPTLISGYPVSDLVVQFMFFFLFAGFVFGVTRYRLFDIGRWWFNTWLIFFLSLCVLIVDVLVAYLFNAGPDNALGIALLLCFWLYFPIRAKMWKLIFPQNNKYMINDYLAEIVALFSTTDKTDIENSKYLQLFKFIYQPSGYKLVALPYQNIEQPKLSTNGLHLSIPINNTKCLILTGKNKSNSLFDLRDEKFSLSILEFINKVVSLVQAKKQTAEQERKRIMRDLHDDVGSKLLSLIHGTKDNKASELAQETLQALRLCIIPLHTDGPKKLNDAIHDWCDELQQRLSDLDIETDFKVEIDIDSRIQVRPFINLTRIIREITNNLIKHSNTRIVKINFAQSETYLAIIIDQLGNPHEPESFDKGTGLNNITSRIDEINGELSVKQINKDQFMPTLRYSIRISLEEY